MRNIHSILTLHIPEMALCNPSSRARTHMTEALHLLQHFVHLWHHISPPNLDGCVGAVPQGHMEHRTVLHIYRADDC